MKFPRRQFLHLGAGAAALPTVSRFAWAEAYPTRPVRGRLWSMNLGRPFATCPGQMASPGSLLGQRRGGALCVGTKRRIRERIGLMLA
jgi:hypothetical protein